MTQAADGDNRGISTNKVTEIQAFPSQRTLVSTICGYQPPERYKVFNYPDVTALALPGFGA